jgi:glycylpeptide N-tetradecanoyltransferase
MNPRQIAHLRAKRRHNKLTQPAAPTEENTLDVPLQRSSQQMSSGETKVIYPDSVKKGKEYEYNFWNNKPVMNFTDVCATPESLETLNERPVYASVDKIKLPSSLEWRDVNISDDTEMSTVVDFLRMHYITDKTNKFKPNYTTEFIRWTLGSNCIMTSIVAKDTGVMCGVVSAKFINLTVFNKTEQFGCVDFLCAHPKFRGKKIAFVLIDEITRRIVQNGCNTGVFTTTRCVPSPTATIRYYHRPLNYKKLFKYEFTRLQNGKESTINKFDKLFKIETPIPSNYVQAKEEHAERMLSAYNEWMTRFNIYQEYTLEEFKQKFINNDFVRSYFVGDFDGAQQIDFVGAQQIDFVSIYNLPYEIHGEETEMINAGYLLTYTANVETTQEILLASLSICNTLGYDVFNVTDIMTVNEGIFSNQYECGQDSDGEDEDKMYEHKFLKGNCKLHFNFFNWKCPRVQSKQINWVSP